MKSIKEELYPQGGISKMLDYRVIKAMDTKCVQLMTRAFKKDSTSIP